MSDAALNDAVQRYAVAFGSPPPMTRAIPPAALILAMAAAVATGRALTREAVLAAAGMTLPDGADGGDGVPPLPMAALLPDVEPQDVRYRTTRPGEAPDPLAEAQELYRQRFGETFGAWEYMAHQPALIRELHAAVKRGRPLSYAGLHRRLGTKPAPRDVEL